MTLITSFPTPHVASAPEGDPADRWDIGHIVADLRAARLRWRKGHAERGQLSSQRLPSVEAIGRIVAGLRAALFPLRLGDADIDETNEDFFVGHQLNVALGRLAEQIEIELHSQDPGAPTETMRSRARALVAEFSHSLPQIRAVLDSDVEAAYRGDPAARSFDEVLLCYPGLKAITHYRLAHGLHVLGARLVARIIAEIAHADTGVDIHPGARIGSSFFIDHGTGVVIGETAIIGERVRLYQAVTLGARSFPADADGILRKELPRHPVIGDDVVIYAGATILGRVTVGPGSVIGGNVWLTESVPPGSRILQARSDQGAQFTTEA